MYDKDYDNLVKTEVEEFKKVCDSLSFLCDNQLLISTYIEYAISDMLARIKRINHYRYRKLVDKK